MTLNSQLIHLNAALAMPMATLIPAFSQREKGEAMANRRLNPVIPDEATATLQKLQQFKSEGD
jgi:hypothetical protein